MREAKSRGNLIDGSPDRWLGGTSCLREAPRVALVGLWKRRRVSAPVLLLTPYLHGND